MQLIVDNILENIKTSKVHNMPSWHWIIPASWKMKFTWNLWKPNIIFGKFHSHLDFSNNVYLITSECCEFEPPVNYSRNIYKVVTQKPCDKYIKWIHPKNWIIYSPSQLDLILNLLWNTYLWDIFWYYFILIFCFYVIFCLCK